MYQLKQITHTSQLSPLIAIAQECFINDNYYLQFSNSRERRIVIIGDIFKKSFEIALRHGIILAHYDNNHPISFSLWVDYKKLCEAEYDNFSFIFPQEDLKAKKKHKKSNNIYTGPLIISEMTKGFPLCLYLVAIGVKLAYRRQGLASSHVELINKAYSHYNLFSDISNYSSLPIYLNRGFQVYTSKEEITYVARYTEEISGAFESEKITIAIPHNKSEELQELFYNYPSFKEHYRWLKNYAQHGFIPDLNEIGVDLDIFIVPYKVLLNYQKIINITDYEESIIEINNIKAICYINLTHRSTFHTESVITNSPINNCINTLNLISEKENKFSPDVFIEIPVTYHDLNLIYRILDGISAPAYVRKVLSALNFRTNYETGNPYSNNSGFKKRIERFYIGSANIQLYTESTISFNRPTEMATIGLPLSVPFILSIDLLSNCGVMHIAIPSCSLPISQLMDTVSRNQIFIIEKFESKELFEYLDNRFKIHKSGTPKCFLTIFEDRKNIDDDFMGALLFGETYYEDNTGLGKVVDKKIQDLLNSDYGIAQYNYATVYCYKNAFVQMTSRFRTCINDRIIQESITLFYLELILFEESAIAHVEENISKFLNKLDSYNNSTVMANINSILSNYAKSSDFWDIPMNYPSSRKSVEEIRNAFQLSKLREDVTRKKETLLNICTIRDTILDETEGYFISIIGIIVAAFSCANLIDSNHLRQIIGFVLILIFIFLTLRFRMNRKIRFSK